MMKIKAPSTSTPTHPLYFDLLRLVNNLARQSRDKIVPTLDESQYNSNHFWQQAYRRSQVIYKFNINFHVLPKVKQHIGLTTASANMRFIAYAKCLIHIFGPYPILIWPLSERLAPLPLPRAINISHKRTVCYFEYANGNIHLPINPLGLIVKGLYFSCDNVRFFNRVYKT